LVAAVDGGMSRRAAAERFGVSAASAIRWVQAWRAIGLTRGKPQGGDMRSHRIEAHRDIIWRRLRHTRISRSSSRPTCRTTVSPPITVFGDAGRRLSIHPGHLLLHP